MDALQAEDIDYARFQEHHLVSNRPCLIAGLVGSWPAFSLWTEPRSDGRGQKPRWDELERLYGDMDAPVVLESVRGIEREGCRTEKRFGDVLQRWRNLESALEDDDDRGRNERWYVKDWHLASNAATPLYSTPELFQDDWLNLCVSSPSTFFHPDGRRAFIAGTTLLTVVMTSDSSIWANAGP